MISILFLDDDITRWQLFLQRFGHLEVKWVKTAQECIKELEDHVWDIVSLDHDLGEDDGCGMDVVRYITYEQPFVNVIAIHSWNQPAASLMHERLWDTHLWEGNLYREVFGDAYMNGIQQIINVLIKQKMLI